MLPLEAFATAIKFFDRQKVCLIAWSFPSEALDYLISKGQKSNCSHGFVDHWLLAVRRSPWSLFDHLIQFWCRSQTFVTTPWATRFVLQVTQFAGQLQFHTCKWRTENKSTVTNPSADPLCRMEGDRQHGYYTRVYNIHANKNSGCALIRKLTRL